MSNTDEEVRGLLGRAFGQEPPLTLDRAEVFRRGHRRVRRRRLVASGGVATGVVAVVVGAVALTGLGGPGGETVDQAASPTQVAAPTTTTISDAAPQGPRLPLPPATNAAPTSDEHAAELTKVLSTAEVFPAGLRFLPVPDDRPVFTVAHDSGMYHMSVDVVDGKGQGNVSLEIGFAPAATLPGCAANPGWTCNVVTESGIPMLAITERKNSVYIAYLVHAVRPDGTEVQVTASNVAKRRMAGEPATRPEPPVDPRILQVIAALPGLTFS